MEAAYKLLRISPLFLLLAMAVSVTPVSAQKKQVSTGVGLYARDGTYPDVTYDAPGNTNPDANEEKCFPWNLPDARATTVSVTRLKIPPAARAEYEKACDAFNKDKFKEAEQHSRAASDKFQDYSAGWVMLGVILEAQHKAQEALDACSHAATIDAAYLPAYLCSAEISVRNRQWEQVLHFSDLALGLQSAGDPYACYYRATAYLHLNNLIEAKKSALEALAIDVYSHEPRLFLLLAEIYEREGDNAGAIAQLHQFLKHPTDRHQEEAAKQFLAKLESPRASVATTH
jgi:tetratricopeptide (TPR) repeat protein